METLSEFDVPVLIAGGGPVGMALATELGYQGQSCQVIERRNGSVSHPKMNMISTRTMEFCRRWGIADEIRKAAWPVDHPLNIAFITSMTGHKIAGFNYPAYKDRTWPHTPEGHQRCSQIVFDPLVQKCALEFDTVTAHFNTEFLSFEQDDGGVTCRLKDTETDQERTVRSRYLVGCDGAESQIRKSLDIDMGKNESLSYDINIFFESQELLEIHQRFLAMMYWIYDENGYWAQFISVDGRGLWRISMTTPELVTDLSDFDPDFYIRKIVGRDISYKVHSLLPWERHRRVADSYGKGRVFLAGDAVHQYSPTGGLGMNTGIQEAVDLGWKLAAILDGWGGDHLLESYVSERRPVAIANNLAATKNFKKLVDVPAGPAIFKDDDEGRELRARAREVIETNNYHEEYDQEGITVGYRYDKSPICVDDGTPIPPSTVTEYNPTTRPGARAPHAWIDDGHSTLDLFGRGFVLMQLKEGAEAPQLLAALEAANVPVSVYRSHDSELRSLYTEPLVLVRPDGHVAWRGDQDPENAVAVVDKVRGALA